MTAHDPIAEQLAEDARRFTRLMRGEYARLCAANAATMPAPKKPSKAERLQARGMSPTDARRVALWL